MADEATAPLTQTDGGASANEPLTSDKFWADHKAKQEAARKGNVKEPEKKEKEPVTPENRHEKKPKEKDTGPETKPTEAEEKAKPEDAAEADEPEKQETEVEEEEKDTPEATEEDGESDEPQTIEVKVNGEVVQATMEDLIRAYQKNKGWEKKFEEADQRFKAVAEEKELFEKNKAEALDFIGKLGKDLVAMKEQFQQQLQVDKRYSKEEMETLRYTDPTEWTARNIELQNIDRQMQQAEAIKQRVAEQQQKEADIHKQRYVEMQAKELQGYFKEFSDRKVMEQTLEDASQFLLKSGFKPEEVSSIANAKIWKHVIQSQRYEESSSKAKLSSATKEVLKAPKAQKPGAKKAPVSEVGRLERQLAEANAALKTNPGNSDAFWKAHRIKQQLAAARK